MQKLVSQVVASDSEIKRNNEVISSLQIEVSDLEKKKLRNQFSSSSYWEQAIDNYKATSTEESPQREKGDVRRASKHLQESFAGFTLNSVCVLSSFDICAMCDRTVIDCCILSYPIGGGASGRSY